jgi:hypothetical protein
MNAFHHSSTLRAGRDIKEYKYNIVSTTTVTGNRNNLLNQALMHSASEHKELESLMYQVNSVREAGEGPRQSPPRQSGPVGATGNATFVSCHDHLARVRPPAALYCCSGPPGQKAPHTPPHHSPGSTTRPPPPLPPNAATSLNPILPGATGGKEHNVLLLVRSPVAFPPLALTSNSVTFCGVVTPVPPVLVDTLPRLARPFAILRQTCDERVRGDQTLRTLALVVLAYATLLVAAWGVCSLLWSITLKAQVGTTLDSQEYVRAVTRRHWWGQQADPKPKGAFFLQKMLGRGMFVEYVLPSCTPSCVFCGTFPAALLLCVFACVCVCVACAPVCVACVRCVCALRVCVACVRCLCALPVCVACVCVCVTCVRFACA